MKSLRTVVVLALLSLAPASLAQTPATPDSTPDVAELVGAGIWDQVACGACLGSYVTLSTMGWGALSSMVFTIGDGICIDRCIAAF